MTHVPALQGPEISSLLLQQMFLYLPQYQGSPRLFCTPVWSRKIAETAPCRWAAVPLHVCSLELQKKKKAN